MTKVTLANVGSLIDATTAANTINSNSAAIVAAIDNTLSRDGSAPNQMQASLDMNSNHILNLPAPTNTSEPLRMLDVALLNGGGTITVQGIPVAGTTGQVLTKKTSTNYDTDWETPSLTLGVGQVTSTNIASNTITNGNLVQTAAVTLKGNPTAGTTSIQDFAINDLTALSPPDLANDYFLIWDHVANTFKKINTNAISAGLVSGVVSIDTKLGTFTTANGLETSGNAIQLTAARRTFPTLSQFTSGTAATYTTPTNCIFLRVRVSAGGGGGGGNGNSSGSSGGAGTASIFNSITANPGGGGTTNNTVASGGGGAGGTSGTGSATLRIPGLNGNNGQTAVNNGLSFGGGGGSSQFGAGPSFSISTGVAGTAYGSGGSGAGTIGASGVSGAGGGGGGEYLELWIPNPTTSYTYTVGAGGALGGAGSGGAAGGAGKSGIIIIEEYYNS